MEAGVKLECLAALCQCCLAEGGLRSLLRPADPLPLSYSQLLTACFSMQVMTDEVFSDDNNQYFICDSCIEKLKECYTFRCQIEDSQTRLKNEYNKNDLGKILAVTVTDFKIDDSKDSILYKCEFPSDDDIPDFDETIEIPEVKETKPKNRIIIRSRHSKSSKSGSVSKSSSKKKVIPKADEPVEELTSENAYSVAVQNLLNPEECQNSERKRNNIKMMSETDSKNYRRLYYRLRYAKAIPFKLDESAVSCDICCATFTTHKNLVSHMSTHYPNHICDLCGKSFVLKEQLAGHMRTHSTEKLKCNLCDKYLKKSSMRRHMRTHTGNSGVYACPSCPERFVSFSTRVNHMASKHNVDIFKYICSICSRKFHLASSLSKHVRRCHFQELNVACPECGKGFFDKKSMKNHMLKHTGEKKYQCEICLKSYMRKCTIREHMKIHENVREHVCQICDRAFTQKCTLKGHMRTHDKIKQNPEEL